MAYPSPPPKNLSLKRGTDNDGCSIEAKWGNPADALWDSSHKWSGIDETWWFNASKSMSGSVIQQRGSGHATGDIIWVRDKGTHESNTMYYNRSQYHPVRSGRYLNSVTADIYAYNGDSANFYNGRGNAKGLAHAKATYTFQPPRAPEIEDPTFDANTGIISFKINTNEGKDQYERYDTMYCITRQDSSNRNNGFRNEKNVVGWASTTDASKTITYDVTHDPSANVAMAIGQWVKITCKAYARGIKGNSATVTRTYYYSYPAMATIRSITASSIDATGVITVRLDTNASTTYPVDTIKLQRLANTTLGTSAGAGTASGWQDVNGAVDNGACSGLSDLVSNAIPDAKKHTWYRLVTTHAGLTRPSAAVEATCLYRAKDAVADDVVKFISIVEGGDGESIRVQMGWAQDDSTNCEIAWSEKEDSWESNQQPTSFVVPWEDDPAAQGYFGSTTVTIRGLTEGTPYYIRARRILQVNGTTTSVGAWCPAPKAVYPLTPSQAPTDVVLSAPAIVERGKGIDCTWTYNGTEQTAWQILYIATDGTKRELAFGTGPGGACTIPAEAVETEAVATYELTEDVSVVSGKVYYTRSTVYELTKDTVIDSSKTYYTRSGTEGSYTYTAVQNPQAQYLSGYFEQVYAYTEVKNPVTADIATYYEQHTTYVPIDKLMLAVNITTGGDWTESAPIPVTIADAPEITVDVSATLQVQPLSITLTSTVPTATVALYITANGVYSSSPTGYDEQAEGDIIWADNVTPSWTLDNSVFTATVTAPVLRFFDGAGYKVSATARDTSTGLYSEEVTDSFEVAWSHQAVMPSRDSTIETVGLACYITPVAPENAALTDVCDIYRHTCDGDYLIATDVPFASTVMDAYAPFTSDGNDLAYRLCTRTADGDIDWTDISYTLKCGKLRFDWDDNCIELPYNMNYSDSWEKGFELREHLDGTRAGLWKPGATRTGSLSTDVIKVGSAETRRAVAELAKHAGAVFVRKPDGSAFQGNVTVESYGVSYDSKAVPVSFNATETELTDAFRISADQWRGEEDGG